MSDIVIRAVNLGKQFYLSKPAGRLGVKNLISGALRNPARLLKNVSDHRISSGKFWALQNVSFEVGPGQVVGFIGANGAGKSTLLKILSRVTLPTTGYAEIKGRVGSLLEVGTGFHEELTGRENVFLSGIILGMTKTDIRRKFDEIVAFSEVEAFLDEPVKSYSSGMQVRLGFSVAAHLEPEVLIVDEVLAVGDLAFQHKSMQKVADVARKGLAVLIVSHNMQSVQKLCDSVFLIQEGRIAASGKPEDVIAGYGHSAFQKIHQGENSGGSAQATFTNYFLDSETGTQLGLVSGETARLRLHVTVHHALSKAALICQIAKSGGVTAWSWNSEPRHGALQLEPGNYQFELDLPPLPLRPGSYELSAALVDSDAGFVANSRIPRELVVTSRNGTLTSQAGSIIEQDCGFSVTGQDGDM